MLRMENIFSSETCQGHFCFISITSSELAVENETLADGQTFVGVVRPRYEILAGCVKVDNDNVSVLSLLNNINFSRK